MSGEGPILFENKPKKSKLKAPGTAPSVAGATAPPSPPPPPPPSPPPGAPFKFYKTLAVVTSVVAGAYFFARTVLKVGASEEGKPEDSTTSTSSSTAPASASASASASATAVSITEQPITLPTVEPVQRLPIPEAQQRELLKWMLEEKRKVKPRDAEEKKRIDEEKAALKQFIRAKSLPTIF